MKELLRHIIPLVVILITFCSSNYGSERIVVDSLVAGQSYELIYNPASCYACNFDCALPCQTSVANVLRLHSSTSRTNSAHKSSAYNGRSFGVFLSFVPLSVQEMVLDDYNFYIKPERIFIRFARLII